MKEDKENVYFSLLDYLLLYRQKRKLRRNNNLFDFKKAKDLISVMEPSRHSNLMVN